MNGIVLLLPGTKVFLLTNSHSDYTSHLMQYAFGEGWAAAFDLIVVSARKPLFFHAVRDDSPFFKAVDDHSKGDVCECDTLSLTLCMTSYIIDSFQARLSWGRCLCTGISPSLSISTMITRKSPATTVTRNRWFGAD